VNESEQTLLEMTGLWGLLRQNRMEAVELRAELAEKLEEFEMAVLSGHAPCPIEDARIIMKDMRELVRGEK
jgi:hypothetical protein